MGFADHVQPAREMGYVMSGTSFGIVIEPSIAGWPYEAGGMRLPSAFVSVLATACAAGFLLSRPRGADLTRRSRSIWSVIRVKEVAICGAIVVVSGATIAMLERRFCTGGFFRPWQKQRR